MLKAVVQSTRVNFIDFVNAVAVVWKTLALIPTVLSPKTTVTPATTTTRPAAQHDASDNCAYNHNDDHHGVHDIDTGDNDDDHLEETEVINYERSEDGRMPSSLPIANDHDNDHDNNDNELHYDDTAFHTDGHSPHSQPPMSTTQPQLDTFSQVSLSPLPQP